MLFHWHILAWGGCFSRDTNWSSSLLTHSVLLKKGRPYPMHSLWYFTNTYRDQCFGRIQIGHTHFTHSFLLKEEDPSHRIVCDISMTSLGLRSVLARIQIGHTHTELTPSFWKRKTLSNVLDVIVAWLSNTFYFIRSRNRHINVNSFKELFEKVPPDSIISYLHEIRMFYLLWLI